LIRSSPRPLLHAAAGLGGVALSTFVCFHFRLTLAAPLCLDLIVVVLVSLGGSFTLSAVVSVVAVACLAYFFAAPLFSLMIFDPIDVFAVALFLLTAAVITTLVSRLRLHARELEVTRVKLEEQIAEVRLSEDQLNLARVNRVILMGEMTASIAHEVNQPLTGILANSGTALRYLDRDVPDLNEVRRFLGLVVRDGRRAGDVIARVRSLTRKAPPQVVAVDLNEAVLETVALTARDLQTKHVTLRTELTSELPPVSADRVQVQQVMLNLIVNAIDAMNDVSGRKREIVVASGRTGTTAVFVEVRDCGAGIDPAHADRLFTSFYTTKPDGMGMGLSISRSIVEAHGGRLTAGPNEPAGAVFRFTLPVAAGAGTPA
jgi:signal transduction histidine kinase